MHKVSKTPLNRLVVACWLLVFPGHFIYQAVVQLGLIPPLLGGYFTASIVMALILLAPYFLSAYRIYRPQVGGAVFKFFSVNYFFWIYVVIFFLATLFGFIRGADPEIINPLFAYVVKFIGLYILTILTPWENRNFVRIAGYIHLLLFIIIILNSSGGVYLFEYLDPFNENFQFDYQGAALSFLIVSLAAGYATKSISIRWVQWIIALGGLFLIGARSEFAAGFFAIALIEIMRKKNNMEIIFLVGFVFVFIVISAVILSTVDFDGRMLGLLNFSEDQSVMERKKMNESAWATILDYPIFGDFASYAPGNYGHNILSAWVDLGIVGFILLLMLLIIPVIFIVFFRVRDCAGVYVLAFSFLGMCLLMLIFAKSYFYQLIPIALGVYSRTINKIRFFNDT